MTDWIDRKVQEPPKGVRSLAYWPDGHISIIYAGHGCMWTGSWTHWMPLPAPPPRMVTIEISEEDARTVVSGGTPLSILAACRRALGEK